VSILHASHCTVPAGSAPHWDFSCVVRRFALEFVCIVPALILFRHQHLSEDFMAVYGTLELKKHHRRVIFAIRPAPKPTLGSHGPAVSVLSNEVADGCFDYPDYCLLTTLIPQQLPPWPRNINLGSACIFATVYKTSGTCNPGLLARITTQVGCASWRLFAEVLRPVSYQHHDHPSPRFTFASR
jgi:hypothetical protein